MLEPMVKVRIYGNRGLLKEFFAFLRDTATLHLCEVSRRTIESFDESEVLTACEFDGTSRTRSEKVRTEMRLIEEVAAILAIDLDAPPPGLSSTIEWEELNRDLEVMRELSAEEEQLGEELTIARKYSGLFKVFTPVLGELGELGRVKAMGVTIDSRYRDQVLPALREKLEEITGGGYQMLWRTLDKESVGVVILFPPSNAEGVSSILAEKNIHEMHLPKSYGDLSFLEALKVVEKRVDEIPVRQAEILEIFSDYSKRYGDYLLSRRAELLREVEERDLVSRMACTRFLFLCEGYLPLKDLSSFRQVMAERFGDDAQIEEIPIRADDRDEVPVAFVNPIFFRPFERLLSFLPTPSYGTIDPTPMMALSFPLFFGIILGDVGYGLITLLIAFVIYRVYRKSNLGRDISLLLGVVSISSIFFGFIFGEFFGDLGHRMGLEPLWEERLEVAAALLVFTVGIGAAHVLLSFFTAILQNIRNRARRKVGVMLFSVIALGALFFLLGVLSGYLPQGGGLVAMVVLMVCIALLLYLGGLIAALELISAVGNILSYSRLMALGIASAALAMVANKLGGATGNIAAAVVVVILLHGVNLVLGVFGPTIHGLRLHYVEFLPRFYKYGGRAYKPFGKVK